MQFESHRHGMDGTVRHVDAVRPPRHRYVARSALHVESWRLPSTMHLWQRKAIKRALAARAF